MNEMTMPSGSAMAMMWMRMPGQSWLDVAASFLGMWTVMMAAMMLPSLVPMLVRYRRAVSGVSPGHLHAYTWIVGVGYYFVWVLAGAVVFPLGAALAAIDRREPALTGTAPIATSLVVLIASSLQFTPWKARRLASCRETRKHGRTLLGNARAAWRHGLCLGVQCCESCAGLMGILLVIGIMDFRAMAVVTTAITVERLAPAGELAARAIGVLGVGAGLALMALACARIPF
jgi:predicted metal-binding membrane protein